MKQIPKPVLILLIVVLVVFVLVVMLGATHGGDDDPGGSFTAPDWIKTIKNAFTTERAVRSNELSECETVPFGVDRCLSVEPSSTAVRKLSVGLTGGPVSVEMIQPERIPVRETVFEGSNLTIDVFEDGGELRLSCPSGDCDYDPPIDPG